MAQKMRPRSFSTTHLLAWLICFAVLAPISDAILLKDRCGAAIPHQHIVLRNAGAQALERHLQAERDCHPQQSSYGYHFSDHWSTPREVISVLEPESSAVSSLFSLIETVLIVKTLPNVALISGMMWLIVSASLLLISPPNAPPVPPPKAI